MDTTATLLFVLFVTFLFCIPGNYDGVLGGIGVEQAGSSPRPLFFCGNALRDSSTRDYDMMN
jgi:hypothetical protein